MSHVHFFPGRNCEFLRVDKADFEGVLRQNYAQEWCERFQMLKWLNCFKDWQVEHLHHCNNMSKTKEFLSGAVRIHFFSTTSLSSFLF